MTGGNMKKYPERFLLLQQYLMEEYEASQGKLKPIPLGPSRGFVAPYIHFDREGIYSLYLHEYVSHFFSNLQDCHTFLMFINIQICQQRRSDGKTLPSSTNFLRRRMLLILYRPMEQYVSDV
jgi:phosphatidylserine decarboxylase